MIFEGQNSDLFCFLQPWCYFAIIINALLSTQLLYFDAELKRCFTSQSENHSLVLLRAMQLFFPFLLQNCMPFIAFIMISRQNNHHIFLSKKTFFHANFDALQTRHSWQRIVLKTKVGWQDQAWEERCISFLVFYVCAHDGGSIHLKFLPLRHRIIKP